MENLPYAQQVGTLESMLEKIKTASVPDKFSQDFVSTRLAMKGGTARSTIPFIKKMGFVGSDGTPSSRYVEFRNKEKSGRAIADSMRELYQVLFDMNEYAFELDMQGLKNLVVEATGAEADSTTVNKTVATFESLKKMANFEAPSTHVDEEIRGNSIGSNEGLVNAIPSPIHSVDTKQQSTTVEGINLSYTINLNLPATKDIEVFNAIFKSLKQHLLQD